MPEDSLHERLANRIMFLLRTRQRPHTARMAPLHYAHLMMEDNNHSPKLAMGVQAVQDESLDTGIVVFECDDLRK